MFRFKRDTIVEAIAVKLKMYDPRDEDRSKGELTFVDGTQRFVSMKI